VIIGVIAVLGLGGFVVTGDWIGLARYAWPVVLLAVVTFALYWFPRLDVSEAEIVVRNVFRTIHVPWQAIQRIDTKYALTLYTAEGKIPVWASPAPSRYAQFTTTRGDTAVTESARAAGGSIRPGDALNTESGAAAHVIRSHWEDLRDDGLLDRPYELRTRIHWPTIAVLVILILATVAGALV
jgi:hypothetical protein